MKLSLRPYQQAAVDSSFLEWESNDSTLIVLPTACGKTLTFAGIIERIQPKRVMVLAHRQELIWQAKDKIERVTGLKADVEMGEYRASQEGCMFHPKAQVIVSTIQTHISGNDGNGRMTKFDPHDFGLLIIDEAHHAVSGGYKKVIEYYQQNPNLKVLGVTATPDRSDEEALGQVFDTVAYDYEVLDAIGDGWIVPVEQQMVEVEDLDFSAIHTTAGDLNSGELADLMTREKPLHGVASSTIEIIGNKRGIGFASSVEHARILSEIFNRHKAGMANWICGKTDKDERKKILSDFANGSIQFLWNCGVLTEGFDDTGVEIISMARPTKSRALYAQMAGRAFRPHHTIASQLGLCPAAAVRRAMIARSVKPSALIIDFVGNSGRHKLMTTADILGGKVSDEVIEAAVKRARQQGGKVRMDKAIEEEEKRIEERKKREQEEIAKKEKLKAKAKFSSSKIDPFDIFQVKPTTPRGWDRAKSISKKMKDMLERSGIKNVDELGYAKAKQLCGTIIDRWNKNLCSFGQAKLLTKFGYEKAGEMTFQQAKATIEAVKNNGWRKVELSSISTITNENPF